jgi:hypothetical protein
MPIAFAYCTARGRLMMYQLSPCLIQYVYSPILIEKTMHDQPNYTPVLPTDIPVVPINMVIGGFDLFKDWQARYVEKLRAKGKPVREWSSTRTPSTVSTRSRSSPTPAC